MNNCGDCIKFEHCKKYVDENETFPEIRGGCKAFKKKRIKFYQLYYKLLSITDKKEFVKVLRKARKPQH